MPYPPGHRDATKASIVQAARTLFNRSGFDSVSVQQVMAEAGLTHGGFYHYFESKSDLFAEVVRSVLPETGSWLELDCNIPDVASQLVHAYLSREHLEDIAQACPMVALPSDVARAGESAKRAFETVFKAMIEMIQRGSRGNEHPDRTIALSITALCVGGMVIARASADQRLGDEVRDACLAVALRLAGWERDADLRDAAKR
jgi:AcrR family transcriptional regulator